MWQSCRSRKGNLILLKKSSRGLRKSQGKILKGKIRLKLTEITIDQFIVSKMKIKTLLYLILGNIFLLWWKKKINLIWIMLMTLKNRVFRQIMKKVNLKMMKILRKKCNKSKSAQFQTNFHNRRILQSPIWNNFTQAKNHNLTPKQTNFKRLNPKLCKILTFWKETIPSYKHKLILKRIWCTIVLQRA